MAPASYLRRHRTPFVIALVAALVAGLVVALALRSDGYESRHVELNDGGIWVTSNTDGLFGRLNKPAGSLDLALNPPGGAQGSYRLDVRQSGAAVAAWDQNAGKLLPVDVQSGKADDDQAVPVSADEDVDIDGGTVAVADQLGKVWASQVDDSGSITSLSAVDPSAKPTFTFPKRDVPATKGASVAVGSDGTVYAANTFGDVATAPKSGTKYAKPDFTRVAGALESVQVSAVGGHPVVLDAKDGTLYLPGNRKVKVGADTEARLQPPADAGNVVVIATRTKLLSVPLGGGEPTTLLSGVNGRPAAPTWLGDCVHAAWGGEPGVYARACDGAAAKRFGLPAKKALEDPVFRVNRDAILLNDLSLGNVYDLDSLQEVDNWSAVKPPPLVKPSKNDKNNRNSVAARDQPPKAVDDTWGARPGRTTILHVLDNDSDPQGSILSIARLGAPSDPAGRVSTAPDGQAVEVTLPDTGARDLSFKYTIDNGKGLTAEATVNVQVRTANQNEAPRKRNGFVQKSFTTSAGGTLDLPVLDDWRDFDGDPLVITKAEVDGGGSNELGAVTIAPSGRLNFVASAAGGSAAIAYQVSDGSARPAQQRIPVTVLKPTSEQTSPPVANPDIARGEVGKPITLKPLANDLPGADPTNPNAELGIAGELASPAGTKVDTDLKSGTVTVTANRPGTFALTYTASYGNAKFDQAPVRIDAVAAPRSAAPPVAVPDTGVLYGQTATTTDVLANDFDPAGGVLVVQRAVAADPEQLDVSIIAGRFLRVGARQPNLASNPQVVRYTITNGLTAPVTGELTLTQVDPPENDTPLALDDYATVRSGDSTLIPVLDNDIDPAGATLSLLDDVPGAPASGALTVAGVEGTRGALGAAYVSDKLVRYAAPAVTRPTNVTVSYVAKNPDGKRAAGIAHVTITPPPSAANPNQAPAAEPITSRVVSGQTLRVKIPTTGVDPDGDTANVVAITSAPARGRVVAVGATSITYEAFPTTSGTDRFGYVISDKYGKTSRSTIAVGVAQVSDPQPPTAVDDTVTASPGAKVRVDVLANDVIAPDDSIAIGDLAKINPDLSASVKRIKGAGGGAVQVIAPAGDGQSTNVLYSVTDGSGDPSVATITVRSQQGYVPPPSIDDVPAELKPGAATATVDVLKSATDPQQLALRVAKVYDARATVAGGKVTVPVTAQVQNIVFAVANTKGATAAAVIHVPARGAGLPYVKPNQLITIGVDQSKTFDLADYVVDPAGKPLRLTTTDRLAAAPTSGVRLSSPSPTRLTVTGTGGYNGPAAVSFEVTDGKSLNDPAGQLALVTIQVQVGPNTPVVRCPSAPVNVVEGGPDRQLDIASLCHVWLADRSQLGSLRFTASWTKQPQDVDILGNKSSVIGLRAGTSAKPGQTGSLRIGVDGSKADPSTLNVTIGKLGRASMAPVRIDGFKAGATASRDIRGSVTSPLRDPRVSIISVTQLTGEKSRATSTGSVARITPGANSSGLMTFDVLATDVPDTSRKDRRFHGRIVLEVLNVPDAPGRPQVGRAVLSRTVVMSWPTPADNGAQIDRYRVDYAGGSQSCAASPCRITGLTNGREYTFTVRGHNAVGFSKPSPRSPAATPDKLPAAVTNLRVSNPQDGRITVSWQPVNDGGTAPKTFRVSWSGGGAVNAPGTARSVVARPLNNHNVYTFTVVAVNQLGPGPAVSTRGQSAGTPATPTGVNVQYADAAGSQTRATRVSWTAADANGPTPPTYTVTRDGRAICTNTAQTTCNDTPATGKVYTYRVVERNGAGKVSSPAAKQFDVAGTPDTPQRVQATPTNADGQVTVTYPVPNARGQQPRIEWRAGGMGGQWTPPAAGTEDTKTISNLPNNSDLTVKLRACNSQNICGAERESNPVRTNGPPPAPDVGCSLSGTTITWNWNRPTGSNNHQVPQFQLGGQSNRRQGETSYSESFPKDGNKRTLSVTSIDDRGEAGGQGSASCDAATDPAKVKVNAGNYATHAGTCPGGCHDVDVTFSGFSPGKHTFYRKWSPATDEGEVAYSVTIDGNGNGSKTMGYYGGGDSGGHGPGTVSVSDHNGHDDSCYTNWHDPKATC